jgi:23S rRNA pseudouridine2604 synthase
MDKQILHEEKNAVEKIRINKYLSQCGICSRREADRMIEAGRVLVNGRQPDKGEPVSPVDDVTVDGKPISGNTEEIMIAFHKPAGIVCTTSKKERDNIIDYIGFPERIYPVGRLDKDSTGLILLTNNGQLMDDILRGRNHHEKEYEVRVDRPVKDSVLDAMEQGVPILDTMTKPCRIPYRSGREFRIIITQGLNRQIRRMCEYFGYRVRKLKRVRIVNIYLGELPEGKWRYLTEQELTELKRICQKGK